MARIRPLHTIAAYANRERLLWAVRVRWLAIGGFSMLAALACVVGVLPALGACAVAGLSSAAVNAANHWCVARWRAVRAVTALAIAADVLLITYLIVETGGTQSPFLTLYVVQVVATAMLVDFLIAAAGALACVLCFLTALWLRPAAVVLPLLASQSAMAQTIWGLFLLYCLGLLTYLAGYIGERLRSTESKLLQSEKMRALGQFVAGIAHELNNPIGFVAANLEYLRRAAGALAEMDSSYRRAALPTDVANELSAQRATLRVDALVADLPSALDDCEEGTRRAAEIVAALRGFARPDRPGKSARIDVAERLERTLALLRHRLGTEVQLVREYGALPPVECTAGEIDQVLLNLLANAADAIGGRGTIRVGTRLDSDPSQKDAGARAVVWVGDDGAGMSAAVRERLFEPFFTTKPEGQGIGLGLSLSYQIVARHGGTIAVESAPGMGTTFTITLPLARTELYTEVRGDRGQTGA